MARGEDDLMRTLWRLVRAVLDAVLGRSSSSGAPSKRSPAGQAPSGRTPAGRAPAGRTPVRPSGRPPVRPAGRVPGRPAAPTSGGSVAAARGYAGDADGALTIEYAPFDDDKADPGEIVWAWVPFEEDHGQGKDRPVLVIGRKDGLLLALMLTSKDHDLDAADEARHGRSWVDIGSGEWDPRRRPSEVRVDRVLRLDPATVRREGAVLDEPRFRKVADGVRRAREGR